MPRANANGVELEYEVSGPSTGSPLLLIHGLGAQLIRWPQGLCDSLAAAGFRVIRYDSRDVGLSTHFDEVPLPDLSAISVAIAAGETPRTPYTISDLASDAVGLLDALSIRQAHVFGVSLGGQVAQALAVEHPHRLSSLTAMMTHASNPDLQRPASAALAMLTGAAPNPFEDEAGYLKHAIEFARVIGSPAYPIPEAELRAFALATARRAYYPAGTVRQLAAGRSAPDRRPGLRKLEIPTLVIHGADDPLVPVAFGQDIANNVDRAMLLIIRGMGHDLPAQLFDTFAAAIAANARRG